MNKYSIIFLALIISLFFIGSVSAIDVENIDNNQTIDSDSQGVIDLNQNQNVLKQDNAEEDMGQSQEIVVDDWADLQYYCSLSDDNYVLKLKENTNYYPNDPSDSSNQIVVKNNVKIIGSQGAYIGDASPNARNIAYTAIKVNDNAGIGIFLQNVTFKWISTSYQPDGTFLQMAGNVNNTFENCNFTEISTNMGHSSIVHIKLGSVLLKNCKFFNCTTDFGCLSVYNPDDDPTGTCTRASMEVTDCYFEGNYARTEPGCINNCGILVVNNSTFHRNSAFWWAGAIHTHGGANTTLYDSDFIDNVAGWNGGALYTYSFLQIYRCNFIGNNCTTNNGGGAIGACRYLHSPYIHIEDSLFEDNENLCWALDEQSTTGTGRGGAISLMDSGGLEVYNSIFIKNSASIGTAICAISGGLSQGSPDIRIVGNQFINHTRVGDVLDVRVATGSVAEIRDNYFLNNSIVFTKLKLTADDPTSAGSVTFHIDAALKNPNSYDSDVLDKSKYYVYVDGVYTATVSGRDFTLDLEKGKIVPVYVVPSISNSKSNEVLAGKSKTYVYVADYGNDENSGLSRDLPVKTLKKAIEIANSSAIDDVVMMRGQFSEKDLIIDFNLTITAENGAAISGVSGSVFKITDGDVEFQNLVFKNCNYDSNSKNRLIQQINSGFLIFDGCVFENNVYYTLIDASGSVEADNLRFYSNTATLFSTQSIVIKSSTFMGNIANSNSRYEALFKYKTKTNKFEAENLTFINNDVLRGCIDLKGPATITECNFINNYMSATSNQRSSGILIEDGSVLVQSCKFINNTDKRDASVIYNSGSVLIRDSIFINNSYENDKGIINGPSPGLKAITANNNWWGNTPDNLTKPNLFVTPPSSMSLSGWDPVKYWLIFNVTSVSNKLELNQEIPVQFMFTQIDNNGNISDYDSYYMPSFKLKLTAVNGTCSDREITFENGFALTYFTLTEQSSSSLTATFNGISTTINFDFIRSVPEMGIDADDIYVGDDLNVCANFNSGVTGEVILKVGNITQSVAISNSKASFTILDLAAGIYTIELNYTGDDNYVSVIKDATVTVNKHNSTTILSVGQMELNKDVNFTITLSDGATGTVDVYVNGVKNTINVGDIFTIKNIARGDYVIRAVYSGDDYYLGSEDEYVFEIGKIVPTISVNSSNIVYGEDTIVNVTLDSNVTGRITVTIDGKTAYGDLVGGKASVIIPNVDAGNNKLINVFYSGDHNYKNASADTTYNVAKANLDFTILSDNIKWGQDAIVKIQFPTRIGGTVTIRGIRDETKNVPLTGLITLTYGDLGIGTYIISAEYNGNNYNTVSKSMEFNVSDWNLPQWANEAGNSGHTGKSSYDSDANGELKWHNSVDEITGNLAIDSEGNIYVTTVNGIYSFNQNGDLRWAYVSTAAGSYFSGISISRDVVISPKADDTLYFINQSSGVRYGHANLYQGSSYFSPVVDNKGNVYISGQGDANNPNLIVIPYKLWENGGAPTEIPLGSSPVASPTILNDDLICVPCSDGLKIVDLSSRMVTSSISGSISGGMSIASDANILYAFLDDSIVAVSYSGERLWTQKVTGGIGNNLFLDSEQGLYSVNAKGVIYRYDLLDDGKESKFIDANVTSGILIGSDGNLYFASGEFVYAADPEGNILWKANLGVNITGTPIMDKNGVIYVNSFNKVYALEHASLKDVNLSISTKTIDVGCDEEIIITLNENATGFVTININGRESQEEIVSGKVIKTISDLPADDYAITVRYSGDLRYSQCLKTSDFTVLKINPGIVVNVNNIRYGEDALFDIVLANGATGTVTVSVGNKINSSEVKNGKARIAISGLVKGDHNYTVTYSGDNIYKKDTKSGIVSVEKIEFTFNVQSDDTVYAGYPVEFVVSGVPMDANGKISVEAGEFSNFTVVNNGQAKVILNGLKENNYTATIRYYDDNNYMANPKTVSFKVIRQDVSLNVNVEDINVDDNATFAISGLPSDANGIVTVDVDGISKSTNLANGEAIIYIAGLMHGAKRATITFAGDDKYNSKSIQKEFNVNKINPTFTVGDIDNVYVSQSVEFKAYLNSDAYGNISVIENGNLLARVTFDGGVADISIVNGFVYGNHTVSIQYGGNYKYSAKNTTKTFFADKINPNLNVANPRIEEGYNLTFYIELPNDASGEVTVSVDGIVQSAPAKPKVQISISNLEEGTKMVVISYSGDSKYYGDSLTRTVILDKNLLDHEIPQINASVEDINVGDSAVFNITLNSDASGYVEVNVEGVRNSSMVINGQAIVIINNLKAGNKNAIITYSGDEKYNDTSLSRVFNVNKIAPTINVDVDNITVGDSAIFEIALNPDATGVVEVVVDGNSNSSILTQGKVKIILDGLSSGIKLVSIKYMGDGKYLSGNVSWSISVNKLDSPISLSIDDVDYKGVAIANVILPDGARGQVKLIIRDFTDNRTVVISNVTFTIPNLNAGEYEAEVIYSGDNKFEENSTTCSFKVNKVEPTINLSVNQKIRYGDITNLIIDIPDADGNVSVFVDASEIYAGHIRENLNVSLGVLAVGKHVIAVSYSGDNNYVYGSNNVNVSVKKEIPDSEITIATNIPEGTTALEFTVNLPSDATGNFTVYVDGTPYTAQVLKGSATVKIPEQSVGNHVISTRYSGDDNYDELISADETFAVPKASMPGGESALKVVSPQNSATPTYSIKLPADAKGSLIVTVDGKNTYTKALVDGSASITLPELSAGKHTITVSYSGDDKYSGISKTVSSNVPEKQAAPLKTKITAKKKTFKAKTKVKKYSITLKAGKNPVKNVQVTIKIKGKTYKAKTNSKGKATFKIKKLTKKGKYKAVIKFKGNKNYKATSKKVTITVKK